ncbi:hypothetical protein LRR80_01507 [Streptomyces sp. RO-S4]|uniref:hypothetical protein n=1 Tax=Streptomyces sp. RO-S4 TaxID=2902486 RepID=UPI00208FC72F|nr:hypothetical protein [Streptomyces sp. RO-S4]MCO4695456.1 hypothetical protein [Streptomyces sp. RO-S4]
MADEQYRWLDPEAAERLLSGEPPEAAGPPDRDRAERLAGTLRALSAPPPSAGDELPGEAAALAAFRKSRDERAGQADSAPHAGQGTGPADADVGLIRLGAPRAGRNGTPDGPRRPRPARLLLAAALVVGMAGGAAVLAGTGLLRTPSDDPRSGPAGSATATHPDRPLVSPPSTGGSVTPDDRKADGGADGGAGAGADGETGRPSAPADPDDGPASLAARRQLVVSACRAWHEGRPVNGERRRVLHEAAGGASRVPGYCRGVTAGAKTGDRDSKDWGGTHDAETRLDPGDAGDHAANPGQGKGHQDPGDDGGNGGKGKGQDKGKGNGGNGNGKGVGRGNGVRGGSAAEGKDQPGKGNGKGRDQGPDRDQGPGRGDKDKAGDKGPGKPS